MKILSTHYLDFTFPRSSDTPSAVVGSPVGKKTKDNPPQNKLLMPKLQIHSTATVKKHTERQEWEVLNRVDTGPNNLLNIFS